MGDFFKDIAGGVDKAQAGFLGPTYNYAKQIKAPSELGMSGDGNMGALARDVAGLINYTEVLVSGKSRAQRTSGPLGNKFFFKPVLWIHSGQSFFFKSYPNLRVLFSSDNPPFFNKLATIKSAWCIKYFAFLFLSSFINLKALERVEF